MADVASSLADWSTTASSNLPNDNTVIGAGLADNLQQIQATVRAGLAFKGDDIASGSTVDLSTATGNRIDVTHTSGTTAISSLGTASAGIWKVVKFVVSAGTLTLTHNATSLILPGGANITVANGDIAYFTSLGSGNWECNFYQRANGRALVEVVSAVGSGLTSNAGTIALDVNGLSAVSPATDDYVVIADTSDSNNNKKALISGIVSLVPTATDEEAQAFTANKFIDGARLASAFQGPNWSTAATGYQRLPSGLILQWATVSVPASTTTTVNWAITFPGACLHASAIQYHDGGGAAFFDVALSGAPGKTSVGIVNGNTVTRTVMVFGIGV